ncbi:MAG: substrate-binding domain-containing protein [Opitutaceae bacterium]|nr:substrate-binding domain-containing protein [Opitutaceae bacterium]
MPTRVQFFFNERAKRPDSFGAHLLAVMTAELNRQGVPHTCVWKGQPSTNAYPVVWERPEILELLAGEHRFALALNQPPPPGSAAFYIDSVAADDFSGGVWAAQWLRKLVGPTGAMAVLCGPLHDVRSSQRTAGFTSLEPRALVVESRTWFYEDALPLASRVVESGAAGIFCCNDRLAQAVFERAQGTRSLSIIGFDNAPVAEKVGLSTIGLPWSDFVATSVEIVQRRLSGHRGPARRVTLAHEPVARHTTVMKA